MVRPLKHRTFTLALTLLVGGCGIDPLIWNQVTRGDQKLVPEPGNNFIEGQATGLAAGSEVSFFTAAGQPLTDLGTSLDSEGRFRTVLPATSDYANLVVAATAGSTQYWGLVARVPAKQTVFDPDQIIQLGSALETMSDLDLESTLVTLVVLAQSRYGQPAVPLSGISLEAMVELAGTLQALLDDEDERVMPLRAMLERLNAPGAAGRPPLRPFPDATASFLDLSALAPGLDVDGDGSPDTDTSAFDAALAAAAGAGSVNACFADDVIRVVMMVDFNDGNQDRNCNEIDRLKWTKTNGDRRMFIVGSLHEETPTCDTADPPCLDPAVFDSASQLLGNWTPNTVAMFDDGTNGDAVAGDNVWTITLDIPWFDAGSADAPWVRLSYKYTWGETGALWTGTEEWPGNRRILELRDLNGDRIITRLDYYGDETTNKDAANLLSPAKGGCGAVLFQSDGPKENCVNDTLENLVDTNADCELDTYPAPGTAAPITKPCTE